MSCSSKSVHLDLFTQFPPPFPLSIPFDSPCVWSQANEMSIQIHPSRSIRLIHPYIVTAIVFEAKPMVCPSRSVPPYLSVQFTNPSLHFDKQKWVVHNFHLCLPKTLCWKSYCVCKPNEMSCPHLPSHFFWKQNQLFPNLLPLDLVNSFPAELTTQLSAHRACHHIENWL